MQQSESKPTQTKSPRRDPTIVVDNNQVEYQLRINDPNSFRPVLDRLRILHPEFFGGDLEERGRIVFFLPPTLFKAQIQVKMYGKHKNNNNSH